MRDRINVVWLVVFGLAIVALSGVINIASAQTAPKWNEADLTWTFATTCSDGSPASNCTPTSVRVERATAAAGPWTTVTTLTGAPTAYRATGLPAGTNFFRVFAIASGRESEPSAAASKVATAPPAPAPGQPTLRVTQATAFEVRPNSAGTMAATRIGILPLGTVCGAEQRKAGNETYTRVDPKLVDLVNFPSAIPPQDVFAKCG